MNNKVSKEYISMLNGVMNKEVWKRECWYPLPFKENYRLELHLDKIISRWEVNENFGDCIKLNKQEYFKASTKDMQATDWIKVK